MNNIKRLYPVAASVLCAATIGAAMLGTVPALGQSTGPSGNGTPHAVIQPLVFFAPPPPPTFTPPPQQPPPPPTFTPPPFVQVNNFTPPLFVPTDALKVDPDINAVLPNSGGLGPDPISGVSQDKSLLPAVTELKGPSDFILVQGDEGNYHRDSPYAATLLHGTVLVSVKRPSLMGMLTTEVGVIAFESSSDAFVTYENGVLRVRNIDGMGTNIKVRLDKGHYAGESARTLTVQPGFELVVSDHKLTRKETRPDDGVLRRKVQCFDDGYAAVSQFLVEQALQQSSIVAQLTQVEGDTKTKRVLADMSRMAAVLNHINGYGGYTP